MAKPVCKTSCREPKEKNPFFPACVSEADSSKSLLSHGLFSAERLITTRERKKKGRETRLRSRGQRHFEGQPGGRRHREGQTESCVTPAREGDFEYDTNLALGFEDEVGSSFYCPISRRTALNWLVKEASSLDGNMGLICLPGLTASQPYSRSNNGRFNLATLSEIE